mmetsp:Transcript_40399/g.88028  ORF Transcript_40399/g.88028 Transcript_40399/m.88028 type:complete len:224 (-) Transcript_40399:247-918(-)
MRPQPCHNSVGDRICESHDTDCEIRRHSFSQIVPVNLADRRSHEQSNHHQGRCNGILRHGSEQRREKGGHHEQSRASNRRNSGTPSFNNRQAALVGDDHCRGATSSAKQGSQSTAEVDATGVGNLAVMHQIRSGGQAKLHATNIQDRHKREDSRHHQNPVSIFKQTTRIPSQYRSFHGGPINQPFRWRGNSEHPADSTGNPNCDEHCTWDLINDEDTHHDNRP